MFNYCLGMKNRKFSFDLILFSESYMKLMYITYISSYPKTHLELNIYLNDIQVVKRLLFKIHDAKYY